MKFINYILIGVLLCCCSIVLGKQGFDSLTNSIRAALRAGNAKELVRNFANNVNITVKKQDGLYSRFQAELIIEDFFRTNPVKKKKKKKKVLTTPINFFVVYSLKTNTANYRVFVKFSEIDKEAKVVEFRLE